MTESYVAVDLETTGLDPRKEQILEIGAVKVCNSKESAHFSVLVDIGREVPEFVRNLTGITTEMSAGGLPLELAMSRFLEFCGDSNLLGHNLLFDYAFLKMSAADLGIELEKKGIDTLQIARKHLSGLESRTLEALCRNYQIKQEHKHRACDDAQAASRLYRKLQEDFGVLAPQDFEAVPLVYRMKKVSPITRSQKVYLIDLAKCHRIDLDDSIDRLTRSQASKMIDRIISNYGRIKR